MKWAVYALAGIMLAVLVGVSFSYQPAKPVVRIQNKSASRKEVYVNITRLVQLHPRWEVLLEIKTTLAEVRTAPEALKSPEHLYVSRDSEAADVGNLVSRQELEAEAGKTAIRSLGQLESDRRTAVESRIRTMRETLTDSAEADIQAETQKIRNDAGESERKIAQENSAERLNAQIKLSALRTASKLSGVRKNELEGKLSSAQADYDKTAEATQSEMKKIEADASQQIAAMHEKSSDKINASVSIYESDENRRIESEITSARDAIFKELSLPDKDIVQENKKIVGPGIEPVRMQRFGAGNQDTSWMRGEISSLQSQILRDVKRMVIALGDKKGVKIVFSRNKAGVPDQTQEFMEMMRRSDWSASGPILSESRRS